MWDELDAVSSCPHIISVSLTRASLAEMALDKVKWPYILFRKLALFCGLLVPVMEPMSSR